MSSKPLSKKEYGRRFRELLAEATQLRNAWFKTLTERDAALDRGKPVDMIIENAMYDAEEDYKFSLFDLHEFLLVTRYLPAQERSDLAALSRTDETSPTTNLK